MKKNIALFLPRITDIEFKKITFLLPYYYGKVNDWNAFVITYYNNTTNCVNEYRGVKIIYSEELPHYLLEKSFFCDIVVALGPSHEMIDIIQALKGINKKCRSVMFCDASPKVFNFKSLIKKIVFPPIYIRRYFLERKLGKELFYTFDSFKCFTNEEMERVQKTGVLHFNINEKLSLYPCGYDDELYNDHLVSSIGKKENIILYTGRIGIYPKNHDIIFKLLKKIKNWNGWRIIFIGPFSDEYKYKCDLFFEENPEFKKVFELIGPIYDFDELMSYYKRANIFLLTSITETLNFSVVEAALFDNYLVSTKVGIVPYLTDNYKYCSTFQYNDVKQLVDIIYNIIHGKLDTSLPSIMAKNITINTLKYSNIVKKYEL